MPGPFAISDRVTLGNKLEAAGAYGVIPGTGNNNAVRFVSESLKYTPKFVQSMEITGDGQIRDLILVDADVSGDLGAENIYGEHDEYVAMGLRSVWGNYAGTTGDTGAITVTITLANTLTASAGTPFLNLAAGQWFRLSGMVNTQNNNVFQAVTVTGGGTVITVGAALFANEVATATAKVQAARLVNGVTVRSFDIERKNADITQFECFRGVAVSNLAWAYKLGSIIGLTISVMGKDAQVMQATTRLPGTVQASQAGTVMNAVSNLSLITEGGALLSNTYLQSLDEKINPNLRPLKAIGNLGAIGMQYGDFDAQISFSVYLADAALYNKYIASTPTSLRYMKTDAAGNSYVVTYPYGKYQTADRSTGGKNADVLLKMMFQALKDPVTGVSMIIDRCGTAVPAWT